MKHSISWWLIRLVFAFVFLFSLGIFYQYWRLTKENQTVVTSTVVPSQVVKNLTQSSSSIQVLAGYAVPTIFVKGILTDYQLQKNIETNETELYTILSTDEGFLPIRIDNITITGRIPVYIFVKDLNDDEKKQVTEILNDGKTGSPLVDSTYVILSSISSQNQVKICSDDNPGAGSDWCAFDPAQKSYSKDELLAQVKKYLSVDGVKSNIGTFSEYLYLDGNVSLTLQVNYHYEPK